MQSDSVNQRVVSCMRSLASMASTDQFVDDGPCQEDGNPQGCEDDSPREGCHR